MLPSNQSEKHLHSNLSIAHQTSSVKAEEQSYIFFKHNKKKNPVLMTTVTVKDQNGVFCCYKAVRFDVNCAGQVLQTPNKL